MAPVISRSGLRLSYVRAKPTSFLSTSSYSATPIHGTNISHMFQVGSGASGSVAGQRLRGLESEESKGPNSEPFATFFKDIVDLYSKSHTTIMCSRVLTALISEIGSTLSLNLAVNTRVNSTLLKNSVNANFDNATILESEPSSRNDGWSSLALILMLIPVVGILLVTTCSPHRHHRDHGHRHRAHRGDDDDRGHDRTPPSWGPEGWRTTSFRAWVTDIMLWIRLTPYSPPQQCAAIIRRLIGAA